MPRVNMLTANVNTVSKMIEAQINLKPFFSLLTRCRRERRRSWGLSQRIVTHIYFQQRQFVQTMWDQAEVIAVDEKLPEGEEGAWATKKTWFISFFLLLHS